MIVEIGTKGLENSWQHTFPETVKCFCCGTEARIAFTMMEEDEEDYICRLHENGEDGYWPHDAIAMALYFCKKCFNPIALWNQA